MCTFLKFASPNNSHSNPLFPTAKHQKHPRWQRARKHEIFHTLSGVVVDSGRKASLFVIFFARPCGITKKNLARFRCAWCWRWRWLKMCQCFRHSHSLSRSECFFFVPVLVEVTLHPLRHDLIFPAVFLLESNFLSLFQIAAPEVHHLRDSERRKRQNRVIICVSSKVSQIKSQKTSDFTSLDGSNHVPLVHRRKQSVVDWRNYARMYATRQNQNHVKLSV